MWDGGRWRNSHPMPFRTALPFEVANTCIRKTYITFGSPRFFSWSRTCHLITVAVAAVVFSVLVMLLLCFCRTISWCDMLQLVYLFSSWGCSAWFLPVNRISYPKSRITCRHVEIILVQVYVLVFRWLTTHNSHHRTVILIYSEYIQLWLDILCGSLIDFVSPNPENTLGV